MSGQVEEPIEVRDVIHEVDYIQECVHEVRTINYEEVIRHQPKIEVRTIEKIVEVPEIRSVQRVVEVPHVQEVVRRVPRVMVRYHPERFVCVSDLTFYDISFIPFRFSMSIRSKCHICKIKSRGR